MDNVPEGLNIVVYRGSEEPKSMFFLLKTAVYSAKFSLEIIFDEPVMRRVLLKSWLIIALV